MAFKLIHLAARQCLHFEVITKRTTEQLDGENGVKKSKNSAPFKWKIAADSLSCRQLKIESDPEELKFSLVFF